MYYVTIHVHGFIIFLSLIDNYMIFLIYNIYINYLNKKGKDEKVNKCTISWCNCYDDERM